MEGVIGYTTLFAGNFAPKAWAFCQGQIMAISSNTALFSILGTVYGGNGTTTFGLPNLMGRFVVGVGNLPGGSSYSLGQVGGTPTQVMQLNQMAAHVHPLAINITPNAASSASTASPVNAVYANTSTSNALYGAVPAVNMASYPATINMSPAGQATPFSVQDPVLALNYIICLQGVYPARN